jgi:hypothetical protein
MPRLSRVVQLRLTDEQHAYLQLRAEQERRSISEILRILVDGQLDSEPSVDLGDMSIDGQREMPLRRALQVLPFSEAWRQAAEARQAEHVVEGGD